MKVNLDHFVFCLCLLVLYPHYGISSSKAAKELKTGESKNGNDLQEITGVKIWDNDTYNAFTDLINFNNRWFCVFREGVKHNNEVGSIRVIESLDGDHWETAYVFKGEIGVEALGIKGLDRFTGVDFRDPKLSITPDGRLMLVMGGSVLVNGVLIEKHSRVSFSNDGRTWTPLKQVLQPGRWLWRVTWFNDQAFGYVYEKDINNPNKRSGYLVTSVDGLNWDYILQLDIPFASESTIRFKENGDMVILARTEPSSGLPRVARIGTSHPPYKQWSWIEIPNSLGGPNFIMLPDGRWVAGSRYRGGPAVDWKSSPKTALFWMTESSLEPFVLFESGRDNSYPGLVWKDGELWVSFYSSHEGKGNIYLSRIHLPQNINQ